MRKYTYSRFTSVLRVGFLQVKYNAQRNIAYSRLPVPYRVDFLQLKYDATIWFGSYLIVTKQLFFQMGLQVVRSCTIASLCL